MILSNIFGVIAGVTALIAYGYYFKQAVRGQSTPNPSTWLIWFIAGVINTFTYFVVVGGNIWQSLFVIAVSFSVLIILVYALYKGRFTKIKSLEIIIFLIALGIGIFWQITANDRISNLLLQGIYVISYIPTVTGLIKGSGKEHYVSWLTAVISYTFATLSLIVNNPGDWIAFVSPVVNGILGNGLIVLLILQQNRKRRRVGNIA